jgi:cytochrome c-type biogenesis protein
VGETFASLATSGPILIAVGVAAIAGLVSFLSPCVLPLVPGYLSYMTGLAGADLDDALNRPTAKARGRIVVGSLGFVAGFAVIYSLMAIFAASVGSSLLQNARTVEVIAGIVIVVMGLAFLGLVPGLQREWRLHKLPGAGLASAPILGAVFALSWAPCLGPTLAAVLTMSATGGSTSRAFALALAYCLGLGLPFLIFGLGYRKLLGLHRAIRRNSQWVTRFGGAMLILVGLALATGSWRQFIIWLQVAVGPVETFL